MRDLPDEPKQVQRPIDRAYDELEKLADKLEKLPQPKVLGDRTLPIFPLV